MATKVPAGVPASLEVTLDAPGLNVGFALWDDSGSSPVQVTGQEGQVNGVYPGFNWQGNSYRAKLPGSPYKWYVVHIAVYTDDTFTTIDTEEPQGSDSLYFEPALSAPTNPGLRCAISIPTLQCVGDSVLGLNLGGCESNIPVLVAGEDITLNLEFFNATKGLPPDQRYIDITAATEIKVILLSNAAPGPGFIEETLTGEEVTITNGPFGKAQVIIPASDSIQLALSPLDPNTGAPTVSDIEVRLTIGGKMSRFNLIGVVQIIPSRYPSAT